MRTVTLAALTSAAIAISTAPVVAEWKSYISKDLGFSFMAPGEVKAELGTYRGEVAGPRQTIVFKSTEDNIEYKVTVMSFAQAQADGAVILGEREFMFRQRKNVLMDTFSQVGAGKDTMYGRKIVIDLPMNKGRTTGAFYFTNGRLYTLEATVPPANANNASLDPGRFVDSIKFVLSPTEPDAIELHAPKVE
jgi:hypothetical protein